MEKLLNKDSHVTGVVIGLILPILGFLLAYSLIYLLDLLFNIHLSQYLQELKMVGIAFNLWPIRFYFVKKKYELTGRGVLLITFIYVLIYFWLQQ